MKNRSKISSFEDFWPAYLRAHASKVSQGLHFGGIVLSAATAVALIACGMVFFLVLAVVPALIGAKLGHELSPRRDKVSSEHPDWAVLANLKMFALFLTGKLRKELAEAEKMPSFPSFPSHPAVTAG